MLYYLDLFAGIGGFALGAAWAGLRVDRHFFSEVDSYAIKVYRKRFPDAEPLGDVCGIRGADLPAGDWIVAGGFPCQDISVAGKGLGLAGARSGLWYEYARLIGELRPRYAIMENVGALTGRGLDAVLGSLAEIGYDAEWQDIRASDVGAPHRRERIWIVAYPGSPRRWEDSRGSSCDEITNEGRRAKNDNQPDSHGKGDGARNVADAARELSHGSGGNLGAPERGGGREAERAEDPDTALRPSGEPEALAFTAGERRSEAGLRGQESHGAPGCGPEKNVVDTQGEPLGPGLCQDGKGGLRGGRPGNSRGPGNISDPECFDGDNSRHGASEIFGERPQETKISRCLPNPGSQGLPQSELEALFRAGWGQKGRTASERGWWSAEPDVGRVAHGIPSRVDRLKGLGNSIVPQIAEMIFRGILEELDGPSD